MEQQTKKNMLIALIIFIIIIVIIFVVVIMKKDNQSISTSTPTPVSTPTSKIEKSQPAEDGPIPLTEEKKEELMALRNITGKISSVSLDSIKVITEEREELTLKIPQKGVSFVNQTTQSDGSFLEEEIGLLDIPTNKDVEIQYNSKTNEVMLVTVK